MYYRAANSDWLYGFYAKLIDFGIISIFCGQNSAKNAKIVQMSWDKLECRKINENKLKSKVIIQHILVIEEATDRL